MLIVVFIFLIPIIRPSIPRVSWTIPIIPTPIPRIPLAVTPAWLIIAWGWNWGGGRLNSRGRVGWGRSYLRFFRGSLLLTRLGVTNLRVTRLGLVSRLRLVSGLWLVTRLVLVARPRLEANFRVVWV